MKRKLIGFVLTALLMFNCTTVSALDSGAMFTEIRYYYAKIYVCDTQRNEAILLNVSLPTGIPDSALTEPIEYTALPIVTSTILGSKGQKLNMEVINAYLLDSPVRVLVAKNDYGYKILSMEFLR